MSFKKELKTFLKVYLFSWVFNYLLLVLSWLSSGVSFQSFMETYWQMASSSRGLSLQHSLFLFYYVIFLIVRYFVRVYRKKGFKIAFIQFLVRFVLPIIVIYVGLKSLIQVNANEGFDYVWNHSVENKTDSIQDLYALDGKHRGMTVYDFGRRNTSSIKELIKNNVEWVVILPYFYQEGEQTNSIRNPKEVGKWSHRDSMFMQSIEKLHQQKIRVHLKPHLWMSSGWRSNINFENEDDWNTWFESYRKTMLHYATMAQKTEAELFCIGTELRSSVMHQPKKWDALIQEIKLIYSGKLTYAANWDSDFDKMIFWKDLDYIGIQAYFPLTENIDPELSQIQEGWQKHLELLKGLSEKHQKKIIFTEVGYRPDRAATKTPWEWGSFFSPLSKRKSDKTQYLAYEALFSELWNEPWFAGTYIWQWDNSDFEIREKPAQNAVAKGYSAVFSEE